MERKTEGRFVTSRLKRLNVISGISIIKTNIIERYALDSIVTFFGEYWIYFAIGIGIFILLCIIGACQPEECDMCGKKIGVLDKKFKLSGYNSALVMCSLDCLMKYKKKKAEIEHISQPDQSVDISIREKD